MILGIVLLGAANAALLLRSPWHSPVVAVSPQNAAWRALPADEREALVARYAELARRNDGAELLRRGWAFARMPPARQETLRALQFEARRALAAAAPARRRELLLAAPGARAYFVHELLRDEQPEVYAEISARIHALPR
jgi:acyl-CoA reductase-like NAD-dependent aldehyde dehydrogenase